MAVLDQKSFSVVVAQAAVTGRIRAIRYFDPVDVDWHLLYSYDAGAFAPPSLPQNLKLSLTVDWENTSPTARVKGHVDVDITKPDKSTVRLTATSGQDQTLYPNTAQMVIFTEAITLDQMGTYSGQVSLTGVEA
jgi:hypothetical protein